MKSVILFAALSIAAVAGSRSETSTYVDGNVKNVAPNTGGTLVLSEEKAMYFRSGLGNVEVPYEGISKVELGAVKETGHDVPLYKVWALHKRANKTETQLVIVNFKDEDGEERSMTLEVAQPAVKEIVSTLEERTGKTIVAPKDAAAKREMKPKTTQAKSNDSKDSKETWWGDDYWKTTRNSDKWSKPANNNQ